MWRGSGTPAGGPFGWAFAGLLPTSEIARIEPVDLAPVRIILQALIDVLDVSRDVPLLPDIGLPVDVSCLVLAHHASPLLREPRDGLIISSIAVAQQ